MESFRAPLKHPRAGRPGGTAQGDAQNCTEAVTPSRNEMPGVGETGLNTNGLKVAERKEEEELCPNILQPSLCTTFPASELHPSYRAAVLLPAKRCPVDASPGERKAFVLSGPAVGPAAEVNQAMCNVFLPCHHRQPPTSTGFNFFFFQTCPETIKLSRVSNRQPPVRTAALSPLSPRASQKKGRVLVSNQRLEIPNSTFLEVRRKICRDMKQIPV